MKLNFSKVELKDIEGKKIEKHDLHKLVANLLYGGTKNLDMVEIAREINKGKEVELKKEDLEDIKKTIVEAQTIAAFAKKAVIDYIDEQV